MTNWQIATDTLIAIIKVKIFQQRQNFPTGLKDCITGNICFYRLTMISIDPTIQDNVQDNFSNKKTFFSVFFLVWILSRTEFCLGLHTAVVFHMQSFDLHVMVQVLCVFIQINGVS